jgi:hypothetical protein
VLPDGSLRATQALGRMTECIFTVLSRPSLAMLVERLRPVRSRIAVQKKFGSQRNSSRALRGSFSGVGARTLMGWWVSPGARTFWVEPPGRPV